MTAHAGSPFKCTDGKFLVFQTLCGLNAQASSVSLAVVPESVSCKACRRSKAWQSYLANIKTAKEAMV